MGWATKGPRAPLLPTYLLSQSKGKYRSTVRWSHSYVTSLNKTRLYDGSLKSLWRIATRIFMIGQEVWWEWVLTNFACTIGTWGQEWASRVVAKATSNKRGLHVNGFHRRIIFSWPGWWTPKAGSLYIELKSVTKLFLRRDKETSWGQDWAFRVVAKATSNKRGILRDQNVFPGKAGEWVLSSFPSMLLETSCRNWVSMKVLSARKGHARNVLLEATHSW